MTDPSNKGIQIKKILRESLVIIASVLLALFANEWRSNVNEARQTRVILNNIRLEIKDNERIAKKAMKYHETVFKNIVSLSEDTTLLDSLFNGYYFEDDRLAPEGIMRESFNNIAWVVAKEEKLATRISFSQSEALYETYHQQSTVEGTIDKIINLLYDRATHTQTATTQNVVLLSLLFHELVAQEEDLLRKYQRAWEVLEP